MIIKAAAYPRGLEALTTIPSELQTSNTTVLLDLLRDFREDECSVCDTEFDVI